MLRLLLWDDTLFSDHIPLVPERFSSPLLGRAFQRLWEVHVCQEPVSLSNAAQALKDYINVINEEADKRTAQEDPLLAAVEKYKNKKRGTQYV